MWARRLSHSQEQLPLQGGSTAKGRGPESPMALVVKNLPASAGDMRLRFDPTHSSILPLEMPWTRSPAGHSPWGRKQSNTTEATEHACRALKLTSYKQSKRAASQNVQIPGTPTPGRQGRSGVAVLPFWPWCSWPCQPRALAPAAVGADKAGILG